MITTMFQEALNILQFDPAFSRFTYVLMLTLAITLLTKVLQEVTVACKWWASKGKFIYKLIVTYRQEKQETAITFSAFVIKRFRSWLHS